MEFNIEVIKNKIRNEETLTEDEIAYVSYKMRWFIKYVPHNSVDDGKADRAHPAIELWDLLADRYSETGLKNIAGVHRRISDLLVNPE